jgi:hypothetical protein
MAGTGSTQTDSRRIGLKGARHTRQAMVTCDGGPPRGQCGPSRLLVTVLVTGKSAEGAETGNMGSGTVPYVSAASTPRS